MRSLRVGAPRSRQLKARWFEELAPGLFFLMVLGSFAALAVTANGRSIVLTACAAVATVTSIAVFSAWLIEAERRATGRPRRRWRKRDWAAFEEAFWAYVERRSDARPQPPADAR